MPPKSRSTPAGADQVEHQTEKSGRCRRSAVIGDVPDIEAAEIGSTPVRLFKMPASPRSVSIAGAVRPDLQQRALRRPH
jgi:hypothetical protein